MTITPARPVALSSLDRDPAATPSSPPQTVAPTACAAGTPPGYRCMFRGPYEAPNLKRDRWANEEEVRLGWVSALATAAGVEMHAERGRRDSSSNDVVIEFEDKGKFKGRATSPAFQEAIHDRLKPYISQMAADEGRDPSDYIGVAIDGDHISFAQVLGNDITHGPLLPFSPTSVAMVALACQGAFRRSVTAENLTDDFGHASDQGERILKA